MHICNVCQKEFGNSSSLSTHKYKIHKNKQLSKRRLSISKMKNLSKFFKWLCLGILNFSIPITDNQKKILQLRGDDIRKMSKMSLRDIRKSLNNGDYAVSLFQLLFKVYENVTETQKQYFPSFWSNGTNMKRFIWYYMISGTILISVLVII